MSSLFLGTVHSLKAHPAWVIAINSNSTLPNDVMSRQSLIDRWGGTRPNMFEGGTSQLFIVSVRTLWPDNGWVIAIYSKVFPNESSRPRSSVSKWRHPTHASMTHRCLHKMLPMTSGVTKYTLCSNHPFPYY